MSDWVAIIGAVGAVMIPLGGGVAFVWGKIEKRFNKIEGDLEKCEERERESLVRDGLKLSVIEVLWQEVMRHAPDSPALDRAKGLLDDLKKNATLAAVAEAAARLELLIDRGKRK